MTDINQDPHPADKHYFWKKNRLVHQRDRDLYYQDAISLLEDLLERYDQILAQDEGRKDLMEFVDRIIEAFELALEHAQMAKGGCFHEIPGVIEPVELVYVDYLKTLYSSIKNIKSYFRHGELLRKLEKSEKSLPANLRRYLAKNKELDEELVKLSLQALKDRIELFDGAIRLEKL